MQPFVCCDAPILHAARPRLMHRGDFPLLIWTENRPCASVRSEEHTSELQSHLNLVCRLLLEKKNQLRGQSHPLLKRRSHHQALERGLARARNCGFPVAESHTHYPTMPSLQTELQASRRHHMD